ncbi:MAG: hypothetical protein V2A63_02330 [Patescibacteria group bacterium]
MIAGKHYQGSSGRNVFRLRDPELHPQKDFNPDVKFPPRYPGLDAEQKTHVVEFIDFVLTHREAIMLGHDLNFHLRDHANRPTAEQTPPEKIPANDEKLNAEEKQHVFEFISFLLKKAA